MGDRDTNIRIPVTETDIASVVGVLFLKIAESVERHGDGTFVGPHELRGVLGEEWDELLDAMHSNDDEAIAKELLDVAVVAVFGLASGNAAWLSGTGHRMAGIGRVLARLSTDDD